MKFFETRIEGVHIIELEPRTDERGFFARQYCDTEMSQVKLERRWVQVNTSLTHEKATLRGLHFQLNPHSEAKFVRCVRGSIFDVAVDMRVKSETFGQWFGIELSADNRKALFVPEGCAHGFLTLQDESEVLYLVSDSYAPTYERTLIFNDPEVGIEWPLIPRHLSPKDKLGETFFDLHKEISKR